VSSPGETPAVRTAIQADLLAAARADQAATCGATVDRAVAEPDPAEALRSYLRATMAVQAAAPGSSQISAVPAGAAGRLAWSRRLADLALAGAGAGQRRDLPG
jgi:hypothetical protein